MARGTAPFHIDRDGYHVMLEAVPAWVCSQCGEVFLEEAEVDAIQELIRDMDERAKNIAVPA